MTKPTRRTFLLSSAAATLAALPTARAAPIDASAPIEDPRQYWLSLLDKLATPLLSNLARNTLRKNMPVESHGKNREQFTHLEAFARLLAGIAPWLSNSLDSTPTDPAEKNLHDRLLPLFNTALANATNPASPDFLNFSNGGQALVDTAFLAQALLRAKRLLFDSQPPAVQKQLIAALKASRAVPAPDRNNWVLFASTVECALLECGEPTQRDRLEDELRRMLSWYKGDGLYGDGPEVHADYYNSFVIHPMLLDCLTTLAQHDPRFQPAAAEVLRRAQRYSQILERMIAPDGSYPLLGRSITYRSGAFHALAHIALLDQLPKILPPAQVRTALTATLHYTLDHPDTFDQNGFLRIGLRGHQPALAEDYISTGSLYLVATALLPLALPAAHPFWSAPAQPFTSQRFAASENLPADQALPESPLPNVPNLQ